MQKKLTKSKNKVFLGVCGGIADYLSLLADFWRFFSLAFFTLLHSVPGKLLGRLIGNLPWSGSLSPADQRFYAVRQ